MATEDLSKIERDNIKAQLDTLGISYANNATLEKLKELLASANEPKEQLTGNAPASATAEDSKLALLRELTKKVRVIISCNDPAMKDYDMTPYYHFSNSDISLDRITIPLNVEWHIPQAYVDMLSAMECGITVAAKDEKGRKIKVRKKIKKYNVNILPPLTPKELEELKQAQMMRDGIK